MTAGVSGTAQIIRDDAVREHFVVKGKAPVVVIAVTVEEAFFHCAKCVVRSKIWEVETSLDLPSLAEAMVKHGNLTETVDEMQAMIDDDERERLY